MRAALILPTLLAACVAPSGEDLTRQAAESVITRVVLARFPDAPVAPVIGCVADNATTPELVGLASDAVTGPTEASAQTVFSVLRRPGTIRCLVARGTAPLST